MKDLIANEEDTGNRWAEGGKRFEMLRVADTRKLIYCLPPYREGRGTWSQLVIEGFSSTPVMDRLRPKWSFDRLIDAHTIARDHPLDVSLYSVTRQRKDVASGGRRKYAGGGHNHEGQW